MNKARPAFNASSNIFKENRVGSFQYIAEALPYPLLVINIHDYEVMFANSAACRFPSVDDVTCYELLHNRSTPCDGEGHTCPLKEIERTKKAVKTEHFHKGQDNDAIYTEVSAFPVLDEEGNVTQIIESCLDISDRKIGEDQLKKSEEFVSAVIKTVGEGIIVIDKDSQIKMVSEELCNIFGYREDELKGKDLKVLMPEKLRHSHDAGIKRYMGGAPSKIMGKRIEIEGLRKGGDTFPMELRIEETLQNGVPCFTGAIRDISERKRLERKIANSEETFRTLIHSLSGYLYSVRYVNGKIAMMYHSPQCEIITGYNPLDYIKTPGLWLEMVFKEDRDKVLDFFENLRVHGQSSSIEHRIYHKKGHIIWVLNQSTVTLDESGQIARTDGLILDITEKKKAEEALEESERNFRAIFDSAVDGIVISSIETGKILMANGMFLRMLGYVEDEILGLEITDIYPMDTVSHAMKEFESKLQGKANMAATVPVKRKDGSPFYADINTSIYFMNGKRYLLGIFRDITERKLAEEKIRSSEEKFRSVTQSAQDAIVSCDSQGYIFSWNPGCQKLFGYGEEEALGKPVTLLMPERYRDKHLKAMKSLKNNNSSLFGEKRHELYGLKKDGLEVPIEIALSKWAMNGSTFHTAIIRNISERKKNEDALIKAKDEAERATKIKDKFVSLVSHDLKNPIAKMMGYLQLIGISCPDNGDVQTFIDEATDACNEMTTIITEILEISRLKSGVIKPNLSFTDAHHIAQCTVDGLSRLAASKGVEVINDVPVGTRIYADYRLYFEVVKNLLSNAIKFCREGDIVRLHMLESEPATLVVSDSGVGVGKELKPFLFSHDKKTSTSGTAGERGTGFGLPLAKEIMILQGGELDVESVEGEGASFFVRLPYVKPRILIVDDENFIRSSLRENLKEVSADIVEAADAHSGMEFFEKSPPHLLLLDIIMPDMNGIEMLECLGNKNLLQETAVIIITGDTSTETHQRAFHLGAADFIAKPFKAEELIARVRRFVG